MSEQQPADPLAALAKKAQAAVQAETKARKSKSSDDETRTNTVRIISFVLVAAVLTGALLYLGPRMFDPYYGNDPLDDPLRARAYVAGLLDDVSAYRARHGGSLPNTLELAVPEGRLPPKGSPYRVEFRVDAGVPVVTLQGGREPVTMRGTGR